MSLLNARRMFLRNLCLSGLFGFIGTSAAAFAARFWPPALTFLPYGVDDPFAPLFAVIRNSFWILIALTTVSTFRSDQPARSSALPIFLLSVQVFAGEIVFIVFADVWHHLLPRENSAVVILCLTAVGQVTAYLARKSLGLRKS